VLRIAFLRALLPAAAIALAGCVVSPQPSPPVDSPELDGGLVSVGVSPESLLESVTIMGAPGSVDPAEGVVMVTNLDRDDAPSIAPVRDDGSFEIVVNGTVSEVLRLQVKTPSARSEPVDLLLDASIAGVASAPVDFACLTTDPALWLALDGEGDARSIVLTNGCGEALTIAAPRLRRGLAGLTFSPTAPFSLGAGESTTVTVRAATATEEDEDVMFFEIVAPTAGRRAITITR
jgi:hypothetical protein